MEVGTSASQNLPKIVPTSCFLTCIKLWQNPHSSNYAVAWTRKDLNLGVLCKNILDTTDSLMLSSCEEMKHLLSEVLAMECLENQPFQTNGLVRMLHPPRNAATIRISVMNTYSLILYHMLT